MDKITVDNIFKIGQNTGDWNIIRKALLHVIQCSTVEVDMANHKNLPKDILPAKLDEWVKQLKILRDCYELDSALLMNSRNQVFDVDMIIKVITEYLEFNQSCLKESFDSIETYGSNECRVIGAYSDCITGCAMWLLAINEFIGNREVMECSAIEEQL